jgi:class 3 adenylate cyclase
MAHAHPPAARCSGRISIVLVRVRIGVHGGLATGGNIGSPGRIDYTLVGDR